MQNRTHARRRNETEKAYIKRLKAAIRSLETQREVDVTYERNRTETIETFIKSFVKFVEDTNSEACLYDTVRDDVFDYFHDDFRQQIIDGL